MNGQPALETGQIDDRLSELAERFVDEHRQGRRPTIEGYAAQYPDLAGRLRELLPMMMAVEEIATDLPAAGAKPALDVMIPQRVGDYRIIREIGRGGMGVVFEAEQISLARLVALKILGHSAALDPRLTERFQVEARSAGRLHHPRIIPVYEVGQADGFHYYTMQRIDGTGLDRLLAERRTSCGVAIPVTTVSRAAGMATVLGGGEPREFRSGGPDGQSAALDAGQTGAPPPTIAEDHSQRYYRDVARIGMHVAESLAYAHSKGILHRDIKPSNLILDRQGEVWVADFGLAKAFDPTVAAPQGGLTATGDIVGTMRYMAPERFRGWSDPRSDVYGLGVTLYELLTLQPAFDAEDRVVLMEQVLHQAPRAPRVVDRRIPRDLETIITKAIDKEPARRYSTAGDLAADLRNYLEYRPIQARRATSLQRLAHWSQRNPALAGSLAAVVALLVIVAVGSSLMSWRLGRALATSEAMRGQAKRAEIDRTRQLRQSLLQQARSARSSSQPGARHQALTAVRQAAAIQTGVDLRNEAIAAMALMDIRSTPEWTQPISSGSIIFGPKLDYFLSSDGGKSVVVRDQHGQELQRFPGISFDGVFSPDGRFLILKTGPRFGDSGIEFLKLFEWRSGRQLLELKGWFPGMAFDFHPDGTEWVVRTQDGTLIFYDLPQRNLALQSRDLSSCKELRRFDLSDSSVSLKYHPSGDSLAFIETGQRTVSKMEVRTGEITRLTAEAPAGLYGKISFNADGTLVAAGSTNWRSYVWDTRTGELTATLIGHNAEVVQAMFAPHSNLLATSSWDDTTRFWDPSDGRTVSRLEGIMCRFSPDGNRLGFVGGSVAGVLRCAPSREFRTLRGHSGKNPRWCRFSPDGRVLVSSGDESVRFWDVRGGTSLGSIALPGTLTAEFTADGNSLITASSAGVHRWPIDRHADRWEIGPPISLIDEQARERRAALTPSQTEVVVASESENQIEIISLSGPERRFIPCGKLPHECQVSADGKWIVALSFRNRWAAVFDLQTQRLVRDFPAEHMPSVAFSPDSQRLVLSNRLGGWIFSTSTWKQIAELPRESTGEQLGEVAFDPSGSILAVVRSDGVVKLHDGHNYRELARLESQEGKAVHRVAFNRDGSHLAVCINGGVQLWDLGLIREQLASMGLDWNPPAAAKSTSEFVDPPQLIIDSGNLLSQTKQSS